MTALDGFSGVFNASAEARFRAMDELVSTGKPIAKSIKPIADKYYQKMFGGDGSTDEAVKYATSEMASNSSPLALVFRKLLSLYQVTSVDVPHYGYEHD